MLVEPDGSRTTFERATTDLPPLAKESLPHPYGLELGELGYLLKGTKRPTLGEFLAKDLQGVSARAVKEILSAAGLAASVKPLTIQGETQERLLTALHTVGLIAPSADCLSPIGAMLIKRGLRNVLGELKPEFFAPPVSRPPKVRGGFPFMVEVGLVYGGGLPADQPMQILRFANRVPLLFQQGACAITTSIGTVDWRRYGLDQKGGTGVPVGPALVLVHVASTKVPFTSEAKEAIAEDPEIDKELTLALQAAARHLRSHLSRKSRRDFAGEKFEIIQRILPMLAEKTSHIVNKPVPDLTPVITRIMDVVNVETKLSADAKGVAAPVEVTNYTPRARVLELFLEVDPELFGKAAFDPAPDGTEPSLGRAWWTLPKLAPNGRTSLSLKFPPKTDVDASDLDWYVAGIDAGRVLGADPLPGDWDVTSPADDRRSGRGRRRGDRRGNAERGRGGRLRCRRNELGQPRRRVRTTAPACGPTRSRRRSASPVRSTTSSPAARSLACASRSGRSRTSSSRAAKGSGSSAVRWARAARGSSTGR